MKSVFVVLVLLFFVSSLPATVVAPQFQCPDEFIGKVSAIIEPTMDSALATQKIVFTKMETLRGDLGEAIFVDVLKNGAIKPQVGGIFKVSLRKGVLCQIEELSHQ